MCRQRQNLLDIALFDKPATGLLCPDCLDTLFVMLFLRRHRAALRAALIPCSQKNAGVRLLPKPKPAREKHS